MKIAVSGKGGSGKTTLAANMARLFARQGLSVLAIDGDPNPNLGVALGVAQNELANLKPLPGSILEHRVDAIGQKQVYLTQPIDIIAARHGITAPDGINLLLTTQVERAGAG